MPLAFTHTFFHRRKSWHLLWVTPPATLPGGGGGWTRLMGHRTERNCLKDRTFLRGKCTKPMSSYCTPGGVSAWRLLSVISLAPSSGLHAG